MRRFAKKYTGRLAQLYGVIDNLFDKQPPILYANNSLNADTDPSDFDLIGRYFWGRVTVKF